MPVGRGGVKMKEVPLLTVVVLRPMLPRLPVPEGRMVAGVVGREVAGVEGLTVGVCTPELALVLTVGDWTPELAVDRTVGRTRPELLA